MDYQKIQKTLLEFNTSEVDRYINYLKLIEKEKNSNNQLKNTWFPLFKAEQAIDIYTKVAIDKLSIDGETITLQWRGNITVNYNYQAYKNRVLNIYPETKFDIQLVCEGDDFSFRKESGNVIYSHKIKDPFNKNPEIIGAYCVIKNSRGEFLETLNMTEVGKMRSAAKTKNIWDAWESEMILKSVIKRACKRHFKDITTNIDNIDNENYDPERVGFDELIQQKIEEAKTFADLSKIYKEERGNTSDEVKFMQLLGEKKEELMALLPEIEEKDYEKAIQRLKDGWSTEQLLMVWKIGSERMEKLILEAAL